MIYHNYYKQLEVFESAFYKFYYLMIYQQTSRLTGLVNEWKRWLET